MIKQKCNLTDLNIWPVLEAKFLQLSFDLENVEHYSIIFTSTLSVLAFKQSYFFENNINLLCSRRVDKIAAVGKSTAKFLEDNLLPFFSQKLNVSKIDFYSKTEGLLPLLNETKFKKDSIVLVLSAAHGKSSCILDEYVFNHPNLGCIFKFVPVYELIESHSNFLHNLFSKIESKEYMVFNCQSGLVVQSVVSQLCRYFRLKVPAQLPDFIKFKTSKQSAREVLFKLALDDRLENKN